MTATHVHRLLAILLLPFVLPFVLLLLQRVPSATAAETGREVATPWAGETVRDLHREVR